MITVTKQPPTLLGKLRRDFPGGIRVYCQYCRRYHLHGQREGHRTAHCDADSNSPYLETGYYITLSPEDKAKYPEIYGGQSP